MIELVPLEDPLMVLGRGFSRKRGLIELSNGSKVNAIAAGLLFTRQTFIKNLLIVGGQTAGPKLPSEAEDMCDYMYSFEPAIPREHVFTERCSVDTSGNVIESMKLGYIEKEQDQIISILSVGHHLKRAQTLLKNIAEVSIVMTYRSEDIIEEHGSREQKKILSGYRWSYDYVEELAIELALRQVVKFDPLGEWVSKYSANRGKV